MALKQEIKKILRTNCTTPLLTIYIFSLLKYDRNQSLCLPMTAECTSRERASHLWPRSGCCHSSAAGCCRRWPCRRCWRQTTAPGPTAPLEWRRERNHVNNTSRQERNVCSSHSEITSQHLKFIYVHIILHVCSICSCTFCLI